MTEFLLHFFPVLTILLFVSAAINFFRHIASIRAIEKHMESRRPVDWEAMGKPSVFSGKYSHKNARFMSFVEEQSTTHAADPTLAALWQRSRNIRQQLRMVTWSAFGMYVFTIFAVRFLLSQIQGG